MILILFGFLVAVCLTLIVIGLAKPQESAQALIGFFLLFLLSLIIVQGDLEYENGAVTNTSLTYNANGEVTETDQTITYSYSNFDDETSHKVGYYLAIASAVGFIGVLYSVGKTKWGQE